ncbi:MULTISPECIES: DUF4426 domain-containing protein [Vibrio]|uniref:DUF4426 domain-containing protein n=1 Tax=Vibrio casei TaxID=673372 RepID=A0A368LPN8_9VIBR|nr:MULTISPECIES: DUF4426 domain-containing protein [Vibrio]RCS73837.1 DUF4426 domain-containing protein [Vibrio casei]SJN35305.1 hypothetical protein FM109_13330 [Vibrio casei]HBV77261.1 DUF4426 domain-containing protein [Vibrio sp.]
MKKALIALLSIMVTMPTYAEQFKTIKNSEIHYSAFNSTMITPEVATQYKLKRNGYSAILNISVLDKSQLGKPAINANITGTTRNLIGQTRQLKFKPIKEGNAIYYLTEFPVSNEESLTFNINVDAGNTGSGPISFTQKFYTEE